MSPEEAIYFAAILIVGMPAAFRLNGRVRNPVALAMVVGWLLCRIVYFATDGLLSSGDTIKLLVLCDMAVITAMFVKEDWRACDYRTLRRQMFALWWERTPWDRAILCLFPLAWLFYAPIVGAQLQYWVLWSISLAQLMLAALESLTLWQATRPAKTLRADSPGSSRSDFTSAWGSGAYG